MFTVFYFATGFGKSGQNFRTGSGQLVGNQCQARTTFRQAHIKRLCINGQGQLQESTRHGGIQNLCAQLLHSAQWHVGHRHQMHIGNVLLKVLDGIFYL